MSVHFQKPVGFVLLIIVLQGCQMKTEKLIPSGRDEQLQPFDPYAREFACKIETSQVPRTDIEADEWFQQSISLESPSIFPQDRDYRKIVPLLQNSAERRHWKAPLNLATLYLEGLVPGKGADDAVRLVEQAMQLSIPAAYDRMGTYYLHGAGVRQDVTRAYAFFQKAARMGNPAAMYYLAKKLDVGPDYVEAGLWANIPLALKYYECAFSQGYGQAGFDLYHLYQVPRSDTGEVIGQQTPETKERATRILHQGVKLGCPECATILSIEFKRPFNPQRMIVPALDPARSRRYAVLAEALRFNPRRRFPNLDRVLPLPPSDLPPWNGDKYSLIDAALGVRPLSAVIKSTVPRPAGNRYFIDPAYVLRPTGETTTGLKAECAGYWKPTAPSASAAFRAELAKIQPGLYKMDEPFDRLTSIHQFTGAEASPIVWERWITVRNAGDAIELITADDVIRPLDHVVSSANGVSAKTAPATGTWQPWVPSEHPLAQVVNQFWRQAWVKKGQPFPDPGKDWLLGLSNDEVVWHLLEAETKTKPAAQKSAPARAQEEEA